MRQKQLDEKPFVSIYFLYLESDPRVQIILFKSLLDQYYANSEIVVAHIGAADQLKLFVDKECPWEEQKRIRFVQMDVSFLEMLDRAKDETQGEYVFFKVAISSAALPSVWKRRHILSHLLQYQESRKAHKHNDACLSFVEYHSQMQPFEDPFGILTYRLSSSTLQFDNVFDELSIRRSALSNINFSNLRQDILHEELATLLKKLEYTVSEELTVNTYLPIPSNIDPSQLPKFQSPTGQTIGSVYEDEQTGDLCIKNKFATLVGNFELEDSMLKLRTEIHNYLKDDVNRRQIKLIAVKRSLGMGDVILTEPFVRMLREQFPDAIIHYYTSNVNSSIDALALFPEAVDKEHFVCKQIGNEMLTQDVLGAMADYDLRFDLDLAYESRLNTMMNYARSYFVSTGFEYLLDTGVNDLTVRLVEHSVSSSAACERFMNANKNNIVAVNLSGSGWGGKQLTVKYVEAILKRCKKEGYKLAGLGDIDHIEQYRNIIGLFDYYNKENSFVNLSHLIKNSIGYIGADSGPMHIAIGYNIPIFIWQGAALVKCTTNFSPDRRVIITKDDLSCLGCKHRFYHNKEFTNNPLAPGSMTVKFVPGCDHRYQSYCMFDFNEDYINKQIEQFVELLQNIEVLT